MRKICFLLSIILIAGIFFTSCSKQNTTPPAIVVDAGLFQTIHLPTDTATLTGIVKTGQGQIASYAWSLISGPNTPTITNSSSATANISGLVTGTYIFQFKAQNSNGTNVGLDTTGIVVFGLAPTDNSILSLFTAKQWIYDTAIANYTGPGTGSLTYVRGGTNNVVDFDNTRYVYWPDGNSDIFDVPLFPTYLTGTWSFVQNDSTMLYFPANPPLNAEPVYMRILAIDQTHCTIYDSTQQGYNVYIVKP